MKNTGLLGILGMVTWLFTALGAIHLGLIGLDYNIFSHTLFMTTLRSWVTPIHYVIGVSGVYSLVLYFMKLACMDDSCSS